MSSVLVAAGVVALAPGWWLRHVVAVLAVPGWRWPPLLLIAAGLAGWGWWALPRRRAGGEGRRRPVAERVPLFVHVTVLLLVAVALAAAAGFGMWSLLGRPELLHPWTPSPATPGVPGMPGAGWSVQNTFDAIKIVLSVVAGIGGVVALTVAYRKQDHGEAAEHRENTKLFNERFGKAAEQFGSDKAAVRLAGVYAMAGLADDWEESRQTCIDVLCAYLRMPYHPPDSEAPADGRPAAGGAQPAGGPTDVREEREVRHTVLALIRSHLRPADNRRPARPRWHGNYFDLRTATFDGGILSDIDVPFGTSMDFTGATFAGGTVAFRDATFSGGWVSFVNATFSGGTADFGNSGFSGGTVDFRNAALAGGTVDLREPREWRVPPVGIGGSEQGVRWPSAEHLAKIASRSR